LKDPAATDSNDLPVESLSLLAGNPAAKKIAVDSIFINRPCPAEEYPGR
jgi:hypothetical protein